MILISVKQNPTILAHIFLLFRCSHAYKQYAKSLRQSVFHFTFSFNRRSILGKKRKIEHKYEESNYVLACSTGIQSK